MKDKKTIKDKIKTSDDVYIALSMGALSYTDAKELLNKLQ